MALVQVCVAVVYVTAAEAMFALGVYAVKL